MKRYTLLEVAGICGVTKNVIKSRSKKMPRELLIRENDKIFVDETGLKWFKTDLKNRPINQRTGKDLEKDHADPIEPIQNDQTELIKELRNQITSLEADKARLNAQIDKLTTSLQREQEIVLHNQLLLKDQKDQILKLEADTKKSWFARHFSRSK